MQKWLVAIAVAMVVAGTTLALAQAPPAGPRAGGPGAQAPGPGGRGATFPAQQRKLADPEVIARGRTLFGINCAACHGADARGGDQGGPNLLRSALVLNDEHGELIQPIVQNGQAGKMPPFTIPPADVTAMAEYLHSLAAQGRGRSNVPLDILVGNAAAGEAAFGARCSSCHAATSAAVKGIATRIPDPLTLQNFWISGGGGGGRGGGRGGPAPPANTPPTTVTVTLANGQKVEGRLARVDDFIVSLVTSDGSTRTFTRNGDRPKVEVHNPLDAHHQLLPTYTDDEIHNITAYLVTLK